MTFFIKKAEKLLKKPKIEILSQLQAKNLKKKLILTKFQVFSQFFDFFESNTLKDSDFQFPQAKKSQKFQKNKNSKEKLKKSKNLRNFKSKVNSLKNSKNLKLAALKS